MVFYSNEAEVQLPPSTQQRASLVPAAAVIPALRVMIEIAAVKTLVVGFGRGEACDRRDADCKFTPLVSVGGCGD